MTAVVDPTTVPADTVEITVPTRVEFATTLRVLVASLGADADFSIDEIDDLRLAVDEVFTSLAEADPDRTVGKVFSYPVAQTSLRGVTGNPALGCAEAGERLFVEMGEALAAVLQSARDESPPLDLPVGRSLWADH